MGWMGGGQPAIYHNYLVMLAKMNSLSRSKLQFRSWKVDNNNSRRIYVSFGMVKTFKQI